MDADKCVARTPAPGRRCTVVDNSAGSKVHEASSDETPSFEGVRGVSTFAFPLVHVILMCKQYLAIVNKKLYCRNLARQQVQCQFLVAMSKTNQNALPNVSFCGYIHTCTRVTASLSRIYSHEGTASRLLRGPLLAACVFMALTLRLYDMDFIMWRLPSMTRRIIACK